jgi:hypothetical protein
MTIYTSTVCASTVHSSAIHSGRSPTSSLGRVAKRADFRKRITRQHSFGAARQVIGQMSIELDGVFDPALNFRTFPRL